MSGSRKPSCPASVMTSWYAALTPTAVAAARAYVDYVAITVDYTEASGQRGRALKGVGW